MFVVNFMKKLAKHSEENNLEPKLIGKANANSSKCQLSALCNVYLCFAASVFAEPLLRSPFKERRAKTKKQLGNMKRKKAAFLYQFIVNDLTPPS